MKCQDNYPTWKGYLFRLQQEAPKPKPVYCQYEISNRPYFYGAEYHGLITRDDGERLCHDEGNFLIRGSQTERGRFTLVLRVLGAVKNFKLYFEDGKHFVGEKRFESVHGLAEDGLITMYVEHHAQNYISNMAHEPVYNSLSRYSSVGNRRAHAGGRYNYHRKGSVSPDSPSHHGNNGYDVGDAVVPSLQPQPQYYEQRPPAHSYDPMAMFPSQGNPLDPEYGVGYVPPDVHAPEYLASQFGRAALLDPYGYHDDQQQTQQQATSGGGAGGNKKNLTPTSSDERKRTKKRVATEDHVIRGCQDPDEDFAYQQEKLYLELAKAPEVPARSPRRPNLEKFSQSADSPMIRRVASVSQGQRPIPAPRQNTFAHVKQISSGALVTLQDCTQETEPRLPRSSSSSAFPSQSHVVNTIDELSPYKDSYPKLSNQSEGTSLEQLMAVHKHMEDHPQDFENELTVTSSSHLRQSSEPVELIYRHHHSRGSSMDGNEGKFQDFQNYRDALGSRDAIVRIKQTQQQQPGKSHYVDRSGSMGSCESGLSVSSSLSSVPTGPSHETGSSYTHDSGSHLSSEEDRNTPSPRHISAGLYRRASESPIRATADPRHKALVTQPSMTSQPEESPWMPRRDQNPEQKSRSRSSSANRKRSPLSLLNSNQEESCFSENPMRPSKFQGTRERRNSIDMSTLVDVKETEIGPVSPVMRHKSESASMREENELRINDVKVVRTPPSDRRPAAKSINNGSDVANKPKGLQRRATTGDVNKARNSPSIPARSKSNAKDSESSPVKNGKAASVSSPMHKNRHVMSPLTRHRSVTSPSKPSRSKMVVAHQYDKEHHYKSHTYRGLQWCEYCGNFMWGIIMQGVQCIDCGLNVHKQCAKLVPNDCQPALKHVKHVFGVDLTTLVKLHGTQRPVVVDLCVDEIENRGMTSEGIYRISGSLDDVIELKAAFDEYGAETSISSQDDVNTVAGAMKLYLRELPVPLIPYQLYSRFINAAKISQGDGKLDAIRMALSAMPGAHLETLKYLIHHLGRVAECSSDNQMTAHNLGIVFGPTLLRAPEKDTSAQYNLNDTQYQQEAVETMIECRHHLFGAT